MTKQAFNTDTRLWETVSDDTVVKTVNGLHYLLTADDQAAEDIKEAAWLADSNERQKESLRSDRDMLLRQADIQIFKHEDSGDTVGENDWRIYRQDLRDITDQRDIFDVVWPTEPTLIGRR